MMHEYRDPYLAVAAPRLEMKGKGAPRSTIFGMLGVGGGARGGVQAGVKSLGGLVMSTTKVKVRDTTMKDSKAPCTEHGCIGSNKTKRVMARGGPYPGYFGSKVGPML
jgi:hypothetical protein